MTLAVQRSRAGKSAVELDAQPGNSPLRDDKAVESPPNLLVDSHRRILRDLRVSITDRCNFRCLYCLPETEAAANFYRDRWGKGCGHNDSIARQWAPRSALLSFEEIERAVRIAVSLGIEKVRLTGGEPLLRQ